VRPRRRRGGMRGAPQIDSARRWSSDAQLPRTVRSRRQRLRSCSQKALLGRGQHLARPASLALARGLVLASATPGVFARTVQLTVNGSPSLAPTSTSARRHGVRRWRVGAWSPGNKETIASSVSGQRLDSPTRPSIARLTQPPGEEEYRFEQVSITIHPITLFPVPLLTNCNAPFCEFS
jgi:hypothetical protein